MTQRLVALTAPEFDALQQLEARIEAGLSKFIEVGEALGAIRDKRLYRNTHATFEDYCRSKWGMSRVQAHRLMSAAQVVEMLPVGNKSDITSERQARELAPVEPEKRAAVIEEAKERTGGKLTAAAIREAAVTTDTKRLEEWVKAHAEGMPVAEIARSYKVPEADVRGALQLPEPEAPAAPSVPATATPAATPPPSPAPAETTALAPKEQPAAAARVTQVWSMSDAIWSVRVRIADEIEKAPEPMRAELKKALIEECAKLCGRAVKAKPAKEVSIEREIYLAYPRKVAPTAAMKAISAALKACAGEQVSPAAYLLDCTNKFAEAVAKWPARDHKFIPHPATWFNRGSYADDPSEWQRGTAATPDKATDYSRI